MKKIEIKKGDKIYIMGTGSQAPYGINEIMERVPAAHIRKIKAICDKHYNRPNLRLNAADGKRIEIVDNGYDAFGYYELN